MLIVMDAWWINYIHVNFQVMLMKRKEIQTFRTFGRETRDDSYSKNRQTKLINKCLFQKKLSRLDYNIGFRLSDSLSLYRAGRF